MSTRKSFSLLVLCLLGLWLEKGHAWSTGLSKRIQNHVVSEKRKKFLELAAATTADSTTARGRRWWPFGGRSSQGEGVEMPSSSESSSSSYQEKQVIYAKPRPTVQVDRDTGRMVEMIPVAKPRSEGTSRKKWNSFKRVVYGSVDAVASTASKVRRIGGKGKDVPSQILSEGYSSLESTVLEADNMPSQTPGQRLMREYQARTLTPSAKDEQSMSGFEAFKEGVYSTAEGVASLFSSSSKPASTVDPFASSVNFKPVTRTTIAVSNEVREALPDLKSDNPIKKWRAEQRIRQWEDGQRGSSERNALDAVKETVYQVGDAIRFMVQVLASIPAKVAEAAEATSLVAGATMQWVASLPEAVEKVSSDVARLPQEIDRTVNTVQQSVETGIQNTKKFVEDVQALPGKTQKFVQDVQALPGNIEKTAKDTQQKVDDTVFNIKVLAGLEEKRPVPPKTPPPEPVTLEDAVLDFAGALGKATANVAWWVGVGAVKLSFKGVVFASKVAYEKAKEKFTASKQESKALEPLEVVMAGATKTVPVTSSEAKLETQAKASLQELQEALNGKDELDQEVKDALEQAEKALLMADEGREADGDGVSELDKALRRAREAAVRATREAIEIENNLNKRE